MLNLTNRIRDIHRKILHEKNYVFVERVFTQSESTKPIYKYFLFVCRMQFSFNSIQSLKTK